MHNITFDNLTIDSDEKLCYINNSTLNLTKSEYNMLEFLLQHRNKVFTRKELVKELWKHEVNDATVNTAVSRLRKKLGNYGKHVVTRMGWGYSFEERLR